MSLIEDAKAARAAGMTYGQYMITKKPGPAPVKRPSKVCAQCGDPLVGGRKKFCCNECRNKFNANAAKGGKFV